MTGEWAEREACEEDRPSEGKSEGLKKEKKILERSEEGFFTSTYNLMVSSVVEAGLDHKSILIDGLGDLVGQENAPKQPLQVFSTSEGELSD